MERINGYWHQNKRNTQKRQQRNAEEIIQGNTSELKGDTKHEGFYQVLN